MTTAQTEVLIAVNNQVGYLTINRPSAYNAINLEVAESLLQQLQSFAADANVQAVVLRGSGDKAFCAGGDIRDLYHGHLASNGRVMGFFNAEYALIQYLHHYPKPIIAYSNGLILGGGMGVFQGVGFRVVGPQARLGMPEVAIGYFPDVGGSYFLSQLAGELGTYLAVSGNMLGANDAIYTGLADYLLSEDNLAQLEQQLHQLQWSNNPQQQISDLLQQLAMSATETGELEQQRSAIDQHFAHQQVSEIIDSLKQDASPWAQTTLETLIMRSPMALVTTLEFQRHAKQLSLSQCLALELHVIEQWFEQGDFIEGVRALLIDKDKNPRWKYNEVAAVPMAEITALLDG